MHELPAHQPADVRATLGWNTWCTYGDCAQPFEPHPDPNHDICNAAEIISVAEAMKANGMSAIGWEYINCKSHYATAAVCTRAFPFLYVCRSGGNCGLMATVRVYRSGRLLDCTKSFGKRRYHG